MPENVFPLGVNCNLDRDLIFQPPGREGVCGCGSALVDDVTGKRPRAGEFCACDIAWKDTLGLWPEGLDPPGGVSVWSMLTSWVCEDPCIPESICRFDPKAAVEAPEGPGQDGRLCRTSLLNSAPRLPLTPSVLLPLGCICSDWACICVCEDVATFGNDFWRPVRTNNASILSCVISVPGRKVPVPVDGPGVSPC